jgi:uncharacterized protein
MTIEDTYTFRASAAEVWDMLLDPQALKQIVPGLQSIDIESEDSITATAVVGAGPLKGSLRTTVNFIEQVKPRHAKISGQVKGGPGRVTYVCVVDAIEQDGATQVNYTADVQVHGLATKVSDRFIGAAANAVMRRVAQRLQPTQFAHETSNLSKAAQTWDEIDTNRVRQVAWSSIQYVAEAPARAFSNSVPYDQYVQRLLAARLKGESHTGLHGAALVCGDMMAERPYFEGSQIVQFSEVDGFDISAVSLAKYQPTELQFNAQLADCNSLVLKEKMYDLIVACNGAHHVYNLGNFFYQANKALKPHGLFFMVEWIGPEYLQIPRANHLVATVLLLALFNRKTRTTHMGQIKGLRIQEPAESFEPSEACNSTELMPQFRKYFRPLSATYYAGLSYPIFEGIAQNIDQSRPLNRAKIRFIHAIEQLGTRLGVIKPVFVVAVAEKRPIAF